MLFDFFLSHTLLSVMLSQLVVCCFNCVFPPSLFVVFIVFFCPGLPKLIGCFLFLVPLSLSEIVCFGASQGLLLIFTFLLRTISGEYLLLSVLLDFLQKAKVLILLSVLQYIY